MNPINMHSTLIGILAFLLLASPYPNGVVSADPMPDISQAQLLNSSVGMCEDGIVQRNTLMLQEKMHVEFIFNGYTLILVELDENGQVVKAYIDKDGNGEAEEVLLRDVLLAKYPDACYVVKEASKMRSL